MPELIEVEHYRQAALHTVGRTIERVDAPDAWFLKGGLDVSGLADVAVGATVAGFRRHGKLLLVDLVGRPVIGLRFGMTGRLVVDGVAAIDRLEYSSHRDDPAWDRVAFAFEGAGELRLSDPRRLGGVEIDPDLTRLGPDAAAITLGQLRRAVGGAVALKARLLDQSRLAGVGNLIADDVLWRASLSPRREGRSLDDRDLRRLHAALATSIAKLTELGGSHTGLLQPLRPGGGVCPRCGGPLERSTIGGRTTIWCPAHQR